MHNHISVCRNLMMFCINILCSLVVYLFCLNVCIVTQQTDLLENIQVWGPGLTPDKIIMPARYFFIETGLNRSNLFKDFDIHLYGTSVHNIRCRIWQNVLDRKDGSYIVRYKLYETCYNFRIEVRYKDQHVKSSPYIVTSPVYHEDCYCPRESFDSWAEEYECHEDNYQQIEDDLKPFVSVNVTDIRDKILLLYDKPTSYSICNYAVQNNEIYRKCYGKYVGFNMFMDSILLSLARKVKLPDMEFFVNLGDWPLAKQTEGDPLPIFSWCGSDDTYDIVMPTYDITESSIENMGRVMLDMLSVQGNIAKNWDEKIPKVFWRGRDSNVRRLKLMDIAKSNPDLFNVSLTNFFFFRNEREKYGPKSEHVSFFSFFDYKYQINIDGTVAAYRFPYLLAGDSLIFKQDSKYYEWFYKRLKDAVHYIPIKEDLSNLVAELNWAIDNDGAAKIIASRGQAFARRHLLPKNIFCYYATLFAKFSGKLIHRVEVHNGMDHIEQPKQTCNCHKVFIKDEL